ncbi:MAG: alpha/beta hydrolase [Cytophagales bacterium]|nr:alpha/beta hydrolase [Cytophagales bacterium]
MGASDIPKAPGKGSYNYSPEDLMNDTPDYFQKRLNNMPEPDRWGECLDMLNDLYDTSIISEETFSKIKCPVLIMSGESDGYSSPESCLAAHRYIPNSQLSIIPNCGHVIFFCNFPAVWESMQPFLNIE